MLKAAAFLNARIMDLHGQFYTELVRCSSEVSLWNWRCSAAVVPGCQLLELFVATWHVQMHWDGLVRRYGMARFLDIGEKGIVS